MHDGSFGPVYDPEDISESMLPAVGTKWRDTYPAVYRAAVVLEVTEDRRAAEDGSKIWVVKCREAQGWGRTFTMFAHGFLSRYTPVKEAE